MKDIEKLFRPEIERMTSYSPIEPPSEIARRLGIPEKKVVKLDANENPFGISPNVLKAIGEGEYYHVYPDPEQRRLRSAIAGYAECEPENIVAGAGADELIDLLCRLVLNRGDAVLSFVPTFSYYSHVVGLNGGRYVEIERESDFSISVEKARAADLKGVKMVFLCSPNNPSGNLLKKEILEYFLEQKLIVVVDEAYFEFSGRTYASLVREHENLCVLRTFSKCFGLAGLRVGYGIFHADLAKALMRVKPPYSVNLPAETAVEYCVSHIKQFRDQVEAIRATRDRFSAELGKFAGLEVFPSRSNFVLCRVLFDDADDVKKKLERKGILIRYFSTRLLKNFIRISVGTDEQMNILLREMTAMLSDRSA